MTAAIDMSEPNGSVIPTDEKVSEIVSKLAWMIREWAAHEKGRLREVQQIHPDQPFGESFWKLVAFVIEPMSGMPRVDVNDDVWLRWSAIVRAIALTGGRHVPNQNGGRALATIGIVRFCRLLRLSGRELHVGIATAADTIARNQEPIDWTHLALLILWDGTDESVRVKNQLQRDFAKFHRNTD